MTDREIELFEKKPVANAVLTMVVPTVISQIITVVYNMADTFFIGQVGNPDQIAAASLCMPMFILLTGLANLFGIGGSGLISRCLGKGDTINARRTAAFSIWTASGAAFIYGIFILMFQKSILPVFGADGATIGYCRQYLLWTVCIGAVPTVMNALLAHLIRAEGYSKQASFGMTLGALLNIILDPIFITVFNMQIAGAALATMLSNLIAAGYFVIYIIKKGKTTCISLNPKNYTLGFNIPKEVLLTGLPSAAMNLMGVTSNIFLNRLMSGYGNTAIAGVGIAKKIDMFTFAISTGMSQGVVPLIGYNYSAKNYARMKKAIAATFAISFAMACICTVLLFTCARPIVRAFIDDQDTVAYGQKFQRIICITGPCISVTLIIITIFQSVGKKVQPLVLSLLRKGGLDIPLMLLFNHMAGVAGIVWATPVADLLAMTAAVFTFVPFFRALEKMQANNNTQNKH